MLAVKLEDNEREKFEGSLAKRQIHQNFSPSINCAIRYTCMCLLPASAYHTTHMIQKLIVINFMVSLIFKQNFFTEGPCQSTQIF